MAPPKRATLKDEAAQSRYRRLSTRMWNDRRVRALGHPGPHPTYLFLYLLTNPATTGVPGLFRARDIALAMDLGWDLASFREAFAALEQQGMAEADWEAGLVWLPNAVKHDPPASPNVVVSWGKIVRNDMPECRLLLRAITRIREQLEQLFERPDGFLEAFGKAFPEAFTKGLAEAFTEGFGEAFPEVFQTNPAEVAGDRSTGGRERLSRSLTERLPESLTRTPTRAQPDAGRPRSPSLRSGDGATSAPAQPSPAGSTDARAIGSADEGSPPPALGGAGGDPGEMVKRPPLTGTLETLCKRGHVYVDTERTGLCPACEAIAAAPPKPRPLPPRRIVPPPDDHEPTLDELLAKVEAERARERGAVA